MASENLPKHLGQKESADLYTWLASLGATPDIATIYLKNNTKDTQVCHAYHGKKKDITDKITELIAMDMRPVNIIEGEGFKALMKTLEPSYIIPKCSTFSDAITLKHSELRGQVLMQLKNATAVRLTTDIWTSVEMEAYMAVTAHLITKGWELQAYVLEMKTMGERHTGENIAQRLGEVADLFEIPNFRVAIVHDNARNMTLCTETLRKHPEKWGNVQGVCCSGHTLQLCVNTAVKEDPICQTVGAAKNLVFHFRKSAKATAALKEKQKQQNVTEHLLIQDVPTRWNYVFNVGTAGRTEMASDSSIVRSRCHKERRPNKLVFLAHNLKCLA